eukprot:3509084-Lingulodinium_polyedra.AAC.1
MQLGIMLPAPADSLVLARAWKHPRNYKGDSCKRCLLELLGHRMHAPCTPTRDPPPCVSSS